MKWEPKPSLQTLNTEHLSPISSSAPESPFQGISCLTAHAALDPQSRGAKDVLRTNSNSGHLSSQGWTCDLRVSHQITVCGFGELA